MPLSNSHRSLHSARVHRFSSALLACGYVTASLKQGKHIADWFNSLTPEEQLTLVRKAGKRRWVNSTPFDRARNAARLRQYRLSKEEALRKASASKHRSGGEDITARA